MFRDGIDNLLYDGRSDSIFFIKSNSDEIVNLDLGNNTVRRWSVQLDGGEEKINSISNGFADKIYFTKQDENKVGSLTPSMNTVVEWILPTNISKPGQIEFDTRYRKPLLYSA